MRLESSFPRWAHVVDTVAGGFGWIGDGVVKRGGHTTPTVGASMPTAGGAGAVVGHPPERRAGAVSVHPGRSGTEREQQAVPRARSAKVEREKRRPGLSGRVGRRLRERAPAGPRTRP